MVRWLGVGALVLCCLLLGACDNTTAAEHAASARQRLAQGDVATAVIELKNALQKDPEHAEAHALLGQAYARLGDYAGSATEFQRAAKLGLDDDQVRLGLLRDKVRLGRSQEVIDALQDAGTLESPFAVVLADAYLQSGDVARAQALYQQGEGLSDGKLGLGLIAWKQGDPQQGAGYLAEAVRLDPNNWQAWLQRAELALEQGSTDEAAAAFTKAAAYPPAAIMAHAGLTRVDLQKGDSGAAASELKTLARLAPNLPMTHYLDAVVRLEQNDLAGAEAAAQRVRRLAPDNLSGLYLLGMIQYRQGHYPEAEQTLARYCRESTANPSAAKLLASVRFARGDFDGAAQALEPYLHGATDPQLYALHGTAEMRLGHPAEAVRSLERAVELAPDMAPFRNQLAIGLLANGDRSGAEAQLESAVAVDGTQFQSDYLLAMLRIKDGDWSAAGAFVEALVAKSPDSPVGYNLRGAVALGLGERDQARAAFERALQVDDSFLPAIQNLARLDQADGHPEQAAARYRGFLDAHPDTEDALLALSELARRGGDTAAAVDYLRRSIRAHPDSVRSRVALARLYLAAGRTEDAGDLVTEALARAPSAPDLLLLGAELALQRGDGAAARAAMGRLQAETSAGADPRMQRALGILQARLALNDGKLDQAASRVQQLQDLAADDPATRLLEADLLVAHGKQDDARRIYQDLAGSRFS